MIKALRIVWQWTISQKQESNKCQRRLYSASWRSYCSNTEVILFVLYSVTKSSTQNDANACMEAAKTALPIIDEFKKQLEAANIQTTVEIGEVISDYLTVIY